MGSEDEEIRWKPGDHAELILLRSQGEGKLPQCVHGRPLIDWSGEVLDVPCGCRKGSWT